MKLIELEERLWDNLRMLGDIRLSEEQYKKIHASIVYTINTVGSIRQDYMHHKLEVTS